MPARVYVVLSPLYPGSKYYVMSVKGFVRLQANLAMQRILTYHSPEIVIEVWDLCPVIATHTIAMSIVQDFLDQRAVALN